jgi:hypothetical protein
VAYKPGPGWKTGGDGQYRPHPLVWADFPGARVLAVVFKTLAALVLAGGVIAGVETVRALHDNGTPNGTIAAVTVGVAAGTIIAASSMAFFGYVIELLVAIHFDTRFSEAADRIYGRMRHLQ